jgi:hypothetical protein
MERDILHDLQPSFVGWVPATYSAPQSAAKSGVAETVLADLHCGSLENLTVRINERSKVPARLDLIHVYNTSIRVVSHRVFSSHVQFRHLLRLLRNRNLEKVSERYRRQT